ncbi:SPP1 gp7 family putative phage head morphogenesis protein [Devosia sp. UYZn731]|uniref:phage minor head protein n=1 Tax=Devosia sp. UYZn731 TaxID=3156345 RepID=UPI003391863E
MVRLPRALEEKRVKLLALAQRRAFESYMRYGHVPELHKQAAAFAVDAEKALGSGADVSLAEFTRLKPTTYYTWRSAGDERVRSSHAAHAGQVFSWASPPAGGHPGTAPNCRCWPEPYYGDPRIANTLLQLVHEQRVDNSGREHWASIETLARPDGSVAESSIIGSDGTKFRSSFSGSSVRHAITLPTGGKVRFATTGGVQTTYVGDEVAPLLESAWTAKGPSVLRARRELAFLLRNPTDPFGDVFPYNEPGPGGGTGPVGPGASVGAALVALYNMLNAVGANLGSADVPVVAFKAWTNGKETDAAPVLVTTLTAEQLRLSCKRLLDVQTWTDQAAVELTPQRSTMDATRWGTAVHKRVKDIITALQNSFPESNNDIFAELSLDGANGDAHYGKLGSTRLDVLEDRREDMGAICVYDVKTGNAGLTTARIKQIAQVVAKKFGGVLFYVLEVRPNR